MYLFSVNSEIKQKAVLYIFNMKIKGNSRSIGSSTVAVALRVTAGLYSKPDADASSLGRNKPADTWSEPHGRVSFLPPLLIWIGLLTKSHSWLSSFMNGQSVT